ncbi:Pex19 protein [Amylocystis lapponica]|nr:Pex19 protein [Amylocystis lapponica]
MSGSQKARVDVDDDVDDLDDVLDQFSPAAPKAQPAPAASSTSTGQKPAQTQPDPQGPRDLDLDEDFARELAREMESLMREISGGEGAGKAEAETAGTAEEKERERAFKAAWEAMLREDTDSAASKGKEKDKEQVKDGASKDGAPGKKDTFQASIKKAMEKLKESDSSLQADATEHGTDSLEALLSQLGGGLDAAGESEEDLQGVLETLMGQLMSKEILYEPLKELHDKFPPYLVENASTITPEDKTRYDAQLSAVTKVLAIFDDPAYTEDDVQKNAKVMELMNEMQDYGSPPAEIMGPMPPGFDLGPDGMPKMPEGCTIS